MLKLSNRQNPILKISKRSGHKDVVDLMKKRVKEDPAIIEKFEEYGVPLDHIDKVHVEFCPLDVSAKTKDKKIFLNEKMLADDKEDISDPTHYLIHELIHFLQQHTGEGDRGKKDTEYLDKPTEEEAFQIQVDFKKREEGEDEAEEYVEGLLDHHNLEGKKRKTKKEELMNVDDED